jgi:hypothetical protein
MSKLRFAFIGRAEPSQVGEGTYLLFRGLRSERVGLPLASVSVACVAAVWVESRLAG